MNVCEKHGEIYQKFCHSCNQENIKIAKESHKAQLKKKNTFGRTFAVSDRAKDREKMKAKLQAAWRKVIFPYYKERGLTDYCWITGRRLIDQKGGNRLYGPQVSHFYDKATFWQLWCHPVNSGICSYSANVDNPHTVASMEAKMINVWGKEKVEELKYLRDMYDLKIKTGQHPRYPKDEWFAEMTSSLKFATVESLLEEKWV